MNKVLIWNWAGSVKLEQYGYKHKDVVEENLHTLIDFFLDKNLKVMISNAEKGEDYTYVLFVDDRLFTQR